MRQNRGSHLWSHLVLSCWTSWNQVKTVCTFNKILVNYLIRLRSATTLIRTKRLSSFSFNIKILRIKWKGFTTCAAPSCKKKASYFLNKCLLNLSCYEDINWNILYCHLISLTGKIMNDGGSVTSKVKVVINIIKIENSHCHWVTGSHLI